MEKKKEKGGGFKNQKINGGPGSEEAGRGWPCPRGKCGPNPPNILLLFNYTWTRILYTTCDSLWEAMASNPT